MFPELTLGISVPMSGMSFRAIAWLSIAVGVLFLLSGFGLWLQRDIFDEDRFVQRTVTIIGTKEVRTAIANEVIDVAFEDFPAAKELFEEFLESSLSAILDSEIIKPAIEEIAGQIHQALTSPDPQAVALDISSVTGPAKAVVKAIPGLDSSVKEAVRDVPNKIVLLEKGEVPSIYTIGTIFMWLGPIAGLAGIGILIWVIWAAGVGRRSYALRIAGLSVAGVSLIGIVLIKAFRAPILSGISGNLEIIIENIYDSFTAGLILQTWYLLFAGLIMAVIGLAIDFFNSWRAPE